MSNSQGVRNPSCRQSSRILPARRFKRSEQQFQRSTTGPKPAANAYRTQLSLYAGTGLCAICFGLTLAGGIPDQKKPLIQPQEFPRGWVFHSAEKKSKLEQTWSVVKKEKVEDSELICKGKPLGYIRTEIPYDNFELTLQWKYPKDANGNSGVLVYTSGNDRIWPRSTQVQLHQPKAGSIFPLGGALADNMLESKNLKLPVDTWNDCLIVCKDGAVTVTINGKKLGTVTGCVPQKGFIALQSEGSEVHFRRMKITQLK